MNIFTLRIFFMTVTFIVSNANAELTNSPCEGIIKNGQYTKQFISTSDIISLSSVVSSLTPLRGEFEKKEDYLKRVKEAKVSLNDRVLRETKDGYFYYKSNYPYYDVSYDIDKERITILNIFTSVIDSTNPPKKFSTIEVNNSSETQDSVSMKYKESQPIKLESNHAYKIGFISKNAHLNGKKAKLEFKLDAKEAKESINNISLIMVGAPTSPYIARDSFSGMSEGSVYQTHITAALINLECAVIINNKTGKVLHKLH